MHSIIYEINTRVWIKKFANNNESYSLLSIPVSYWKSLADKGVKYIWLMGIWETNKESIKKYCFTEGLKKEYNLALPDWNEDDVIGSPYAINNYSPNSGLTSSEELVDLKTRLNSFGLKLILDFIPNHFSAFTDLQNTNREIFLKGNEELFEKFGDTFFKSTSGEIFAHGKDPNFPAWEDTIQINYFSESARKFMINSLLEISNFCDGVRCDMAMLQLNREFKNTWKKTIAALGIRELKTEFWDEAIKRVRSSNPNFLFMAEAYWNLEWYLQQLGFNFTYDKRLLERLQYSDTESILLHLNADKKFQEKSIRFIENHDEQRAIKALGKKRSLAAAVIISTINGLTLFYEGQFEGKNVRTPVQLGREMIEEKDLETENFYNTLLKTINDEVFINGNWSKLQPIMIEGNQTANNFLAWKWELHGDERIVIINYSSVASYCYLKFKVDSPKDEILLADLLNGKEYVRSVDEINNGKLFIHLEPYQSHIFRIK